MREKGRGSWNPLGGSERRMAGRENGGCYPTREEGYGEGKKGGGEKRVVEKVKTGEEGTICCFKPLANGKIGAHQENSESKL